MRKTSFKLFLIVAIIFVGVFSLVFVSDTKVFAQVDDKIIVETTGYSMLSESSFVFGGYYSGNFDKKGFTTYFEFKKDDNNLDISEDREETIKIERPSKLKPTVDEYSYFYTSPELKLFSDYFFRAVGYFNDVPDKKYYGETLHMRTGYIPYGMTYPFSVDKNNKSIKYNIPNTCDFLGGLLSGICDTKSTSNLAEKWYFQGQLTGNTNIDTEGPFTSKESCISNKNIYVGQNIGKILKDCYKVTSNVLPDPTVPGWYFQGQIIGNTNTDIEGPFASEQVCNDNENIYAGQDIGKILKDCFEVASNITTPTPSKPVDSLSGKLVPCDETNEPCNFNKFLDLINNVLKFVFVDLVLPIAAIMFAYAGFELVTSGGSTEKKSKAKSIFTNVAIGLIVAAAAFLIVKAILSIVGYTGTSFLK